MKKQTIEKLSGLAAISTAMGTSADAALVASATIPSGGLVSPSSPGTINWDIDNDGTDDFRFSFNSSGFSSTYYGSLYMSDLGDARVARPDGSSNIFAKLSSGAKLGTAADGLSFNAAREIRTLVISYSGTNITGYYPANGGWSLGDTGYFGFKFTSSGNTHYGWAEMTLSSGSQPWATINEAWYNDTPDGEVTVGVVPEPAEVGLGLGALALGAAGLRRIRQKRKAA